MRGSARALLVALGIVAFIGCMAGPAATRPDQSDADGARIALIAQTTWVPAHGDFLMAARISGGSRRGSVRVSVHRRIANRAALEDAVDSNKAGRELFNLDLMPVEDQPSGPDGTREVTIPIHTDQSRTTAQTEPPGVYPVQVRLLESDGTIMARLTTFLIRTPEESLPVNRLRAALVLKLHEPLTVHDGAATLNRRGLQSVRTVVDALATHPTVPATLVPTPQSLEALRDSKDGRDAALLDEIITSSGAGRQVLASPYVRLDASAWLSADLGQELTHQQLVGTAVLSSMLPAADHRTWTADADLTSATLGRLRDAGVQQLLVPEESLAPLDRAKFPDSPLEPFKVDTDTGIPIPSVQIDGRLRSAFERGSDPVLGANQVLAELAIASFELNRTPGGVVLAPPDDWRPSATFLKVLLDGLASANPLIEPTTVDHLFAQVPPAGANGSASVRGGGDRGFDLVRGLAPQPSPSLGGFAGRMKSTRRRLASYASMVGPTSPRLGPFERRLLLAGSADLSARRQDGLITLADRELDRQFRGVVAPQTEKVTLTARNADFPLTLQSKLGYPINVVIDLQASNRLAFPGGTRIQKKLEGQRTRVKLRVRAPVSGDTPVQVTVHSPDGNIVLATSRYTVRVTAVSGVGVVLTIGAALFLVIWWVRHWRTSARTQRNGSTGP